jgi:hypothetical protein
MYLWRKLLCNLWWWSLNLLRSWLVCKLVWNTSWFHGLPGYTGLSLLNYLLGGWFSYLILYNWSILLQIVNGQVIHWEAMVLTCLVHDLVKFCTASVALFGFISFLFLGVNHELASMLTILLCRWAFVRVVGESWFIFAVTGVKAIFAFGVFVG